MPLAVGTRLADDHDRQETGRPSLCSSVLHLPALTPSSKFRPAHALSLLPSVGQ